MKKEDYDEIEEYDEEYDEVDTDYDEDEYDDEEEYDEDEDDDEEEYDEDEDEDEVEGLSAKELELIATDYSVPVSDDSIEELKYLLDSYFKIQDVDPDLEDEEELKDYALEIIRAIVLEYEIPADDLLYLFKFVLTLESYYEKHSNDIIFKEIDSEEGIKTLKLRVDEYLAECPDLFDSIEIYGSLFNIDKSLTGTKLYKATLENFYKMLVDIATAESFGMLVDLFVEKKQMADKYLDLMPVPSATAQELSAAFDILLNCKGSGSTLRKKREEAKALIRQKYSNDEPLMQKLTELELQEANEKGAAIYNMVKFGSLAVAILVLLMSVIFGIILVVAWGAMFFSPLHDKVPFLVKGKECLKNRRK